MTLKDILIIIGSSVAITTALVVSIKVGELYNSTVDTVEKANTVVDTLYRHDADIDNVLNWISKLPTTSPPTPVKSSTNSK